MSKELFVSSTPHETKVAIVEEDLLTEVYFERENEYTLAGSIYKGRVTRVLPGMQSAFVSIGLDRDAFLYVSDFLLEEEEDADALEQVVSRSRVDVQEPDLRLEVQGPIEADEVFPPVETRQAESGSAFRAEPAAEHGNGEEGEREGARRWRGRRRRGKGRGFPERESRPEHGPRPEQRESPPPESEPRAEREFRSERAEREHRPDQPAHDLQHQTARHEVRHEAARPEPSSSQPPILLPGESISKYQPRSAQPGPARTAIAPPPRSSGSKPSTEYSLDPSQFSAGSMTLPGESLAKYRRGESPSHEVARTASRRHADAEEIEAPSHSHSTEVAQAVSAPVETPVSHEIEGSEHHAEATAAHSLAEVEEGFEPHTRSHHVIEKQAEEKPEEVQRLENMNVAAAFGGDLVEPEDTPEVEESQEEPGAQQIHQQHSATPVEELPQPQHAAERGLMEEEEIEEEESDLPGYEESLDLADYEELEEEELARMDEQMVQLGSELTEAVRDAHVNEHATGQYEAEGLELPEGFEEEVAQRFEAAGEEEDDEDEGEGSDLELAEETEGPEGARAEMRAPDGTAGYQQRPERRSGDRRGPRRVGRRMRGRPPRFQSQRHLPAISDLLKEGQEILVQIAKEPIAKKGARITSHIALPGRFLVYMPTVHHTGVSRKIASEEERHRLKRIVMSERGESQGGFIVRTAAAGAQEEDLRADIRFLINLWTEIRGRAEKSKAPALIYHDLNLVERILRDQVTVSFSSIWVDTEQEYERILRFVSRFQPSLVKRVKLYTKETPLFEQFSISDEINKALKSKVWLKSGGYIVINQTEALVAIDVNTGKFVGKTARLEDTIVKTNIDAIREIVRQIRLRDLGGIIVIDFIDMDERKNRHRVMQALEEALKNDRAPSKVLQFNDFGLVAITRKRVKQSLERTLGQQCPICTGTGMIKSVSTVCNEIYVEMRKMARHFDRDLMLRVNPEVAKALKGNNARWLQEMEELTKQTILVKSDPLLHPEQFDIQ